MNSGTINSPLLCRGSPYSPGQGQLYSPPPKHGVSHLVHYPLSVMLSSMFCMDMPRSFRYDFPLSTITFTAPETIRSRMAPPMTWSGNAPYQSWGGLFDVIIVVYLPSRSSAMA